ncbi:hypothetical protein DFJ58DRAFT_719457 [Suillus subalutaceus]|uniref:uncharacterized protein n=1 Tax=Suillus subalutaceus TaxID=48586 RepID=UPI001B865596|nr:uncharacterized protein DFJ58DRAFT_719457 [Suillus subalutaceus]KAG1833221.1 hypothetical protein DFJ58DRAFT_719457 [Suillus subalutaceus]
MLQKTRGVNSWNTFVKAQLKAENEGLGRGDHTKLTAFIAENKATLVRDYRKLTFAEKQAYNACVLEDHQAKNHTARVNPKAIKHDVNAAFTFMDHEVCCAILIIPSLLSPPVWHLSHTNITEIYSQWMALHARTGLEGFYVAVCGRIEDLAEPKVFFTEKSQKFVLDLEAFIITKLGMLSLPSYEHVTLNCQQPLNKLISECCMLIQDNLEFILMEKNTTGEVKMNYTNYECAIVECHGVELTKWPLPGG